MVKHLCVGFDYELVLGECPWSPHHWWTEISFRLLYCPCPPWPKWIKYYNTTVCWHSMHNGLTDTLLISSIVATINWVPVIGVHVQCHLTIIHAGATLGLVVRLEIYSTRALSCHQIDQWAQSDSAPRPLRRTYIYNFHHGLTRSRVEVGLGVIHPGGLSIIDYRLPTWELVQPFSRRYCL